MKFSRICDTGNLCAGNPVLYAGNISGNSRTRPNGKIPVQMAKYLSKMTGGRVSRKYTDGENFLHAKICCSTVPKARTMLFVPWLMSISTSTQGNAITLIFWPFWMENPTSIAFFIMYRLYWHNLPLAVAVKKLLYLGNAVWEDYFRLYLYSSTCPSNVNLQPYQSGIRQ